MWECRYYSAIVDKHKYLLATSRYIEQNPVRAKIISNPLKYPWSSAQINVTVNKKTFVKPICDVYGIDRNTYAEALNLGCNNDEVRLIIKSTMSGKPIGSMLFIENLVNTFGMTFSLKSRGRPRKNE